MAEDNIYNEVLKRTSKWGDKERYYPQIVAEDMPDQEDIPEGSLLEFFMSGALGFGSGITWGASELIDTPDWALMSKSARAGWVTGEGLSLFSPVGPFGLMGRGSRKVAKLLGNKGVRNFTKESVESISGKLSKVEAKAYKRNLEKAAKAKFGSASASNMKKVEDSLNKTISKEVNKTIQSDISVSWIKEAGLSGKIGLDAVKNLEIVGSIALKNAYKKAGIEIGEEVAESVSKTLVKSIRGGKGYANDIAEIVERTLRGAAPGRVRTNIARYFGMVAQDMVMMSTHSLIAQKFKSMANETEFSFWDNLSHSGMMALVFPAVRAIPGGGRESLRNGLPSLARMFKRTDYKNMSQKDLGRLMTVMARGTKTDLWNRSKLGNSFWSIGDKKIGGVQDIINHIKGNKLLGIEKLTKDELLILAKKMNNHTHKEFLRFWGPRMRQDLVASIPRMLLGTLAMNPDMFKKGFFDTISHQELGAHFMMGLMMTRHRGAWGKDGTIFGGPSNRAYMAEYGPYKRALKLMGSTTKNIDGNLAMMEGLDPWVALNDYISSGTVGHDLTIAIDKVLSDPNIKNTLISPSGNDYNVKTHGRVAKFLQIYNTMKVAQDPAFEPLEIKHLSNQALNAMKSRIDKIVVEKGEGTNPDITVGQIGFAGTLPKITKEGRADVIEIYRSMLKELSDKLGFEVNINEKTGEIQAFLVDGKEGQNLGEAMAYNNIVRTLDALNIVSMRTKSDLKDLDTLLKETKMSAETFDGEVFKIMNMHMDVMSKRFGNKEIVMDADDNSILSFIRDSALVEANERIFKLVEGQPVSQSDKNLLLMLDKMFMLSDGRYLKDISEYEIIGYDPSATEGKSGDLAMKVQDSIGFLRDLFNFRGMHLNKSSGPSKDIKNKLTIRAEDLISLADMW